MAKHRVLDQKEVGRLTASECGWPGDDNVRRLAEAVNERSQFVIFGHEHFNINYYDQARHVFVSPAEIGKFTPCGYFQYEVLKAVL